MSNNSRDKFKKAYNDTAKNKTIGQVAKKLKMSESTVRRLVKKYTTEGMYLVNRGKSKEEKATAHNEKLEIVRLRNKCSQLQSDMQEIEKKTLTTDAIRELIYGTASIDFNKQADWLITKKIKSNTGIPLMFLSDIHFDETVDPGQVNMMNEYNRSIATKRLEYTFKAGVNILMNRMVNPKYEGIVLVLGGDIISGNIHEELRETNEYPILLSVVRITQILAEAIEEYAKIFKRVFVPCVTGNHGRLDKKPRVKNAVFDNFEWMVYQRLAERFMDDDRVTLMIPDSGEAQFQIYGKSFILSHGDEFKGGHAIAGIFSPLMLGMYKKQKRQMSMNRGFDVMLTAHFHQYVHTNSLVINGSVKGFDEFSRKYNFPFERPQQALWINHPERGMIHRTPILCDGYEDKKKSFKEKIVIL